MPRLDCLAAMEALAKVAGGVTGQGFGTAETPWKGWDCDLCVVVATILLLIHKGRISNAEVCLVINHNLQCGDCASAGRGLVRNGMEAKRVDSDGAQRNMSLLV